MARVIYACIVGSHMHGTATPESDRDVKMVYVPSAREYILGLKKRMDLTIQKGTEAEPYSLKKFLELLTEGQTVAWDMMFAAKEHVLKSSPEWEEILSHRDEFMFKGNTAFVGYCRKQATRYCTKAERLNAVKDVMQKLAPYKPDLRLGEALKRDSVDFVGKHGEHVILENVKQPDGKFIEHLTVCGRQLPLTVKVGYALDLYQKIIDEYGARAGAASIKGEKDWKALSHAVRIIEEVNELLSDGRITLPRPNAEFLLKIKQGKVPFYVVKDILDVGERQMEDALRNSTLPDDPNTELADRIVFDVYQKEIAG